MEEALDRPNYIKHSWRNKHIEEDAHAVKPSKYLVIGAYYFNNSKEGITGLNVCVENEENQTFVITLTQEKSDSYSYGIWNISPCTEEDINKCTLEPLDWEDACITLYERDREDINNHLFSCFYYGKESDGYYSSGSWTIHRDAWGAIHCNRV